MTDEFRGQPVQTPVELWDMMVEDNLLIRLWGVNSPYARAMQMCFYNGLRCGLTIRDQINLRAVDDDDYDRLIDKFDNEVQMFFDDDPSEQMMDELRDKGLLG